MKAKCSLVNSVNNLERITMVNEVGFCLTFIKLMPWQSSELISGTNNAWPFVIRNRFVDF